MEDGVTIHYGTGPLPDFHLVTAYVPLCPNYPLFNKLKGLPQLGRIVAIARIELCE